MMPTKLGVYRSNHRGSWVIDRRFRDVGEIRRSTGTPSLETAQAINGMLTSLYQVGRLDLLKRIKSRDLSLLEAYSLHIQGDLLTAGKREGLRTLVWRPWVKSYYCSEEWRKKMTQWFKRIEQPGMLLEDLPQVLRGLKEDLQQSPASFNQAKTIIQNFVRHQIGRQNSIYRELADVPRMSYNGGIQQSFNLSELAQLLKAMPLKLRADTIALFLTGMNPKEYWKDGWTVLPDRIAVHGKKSKGRERVIPLVQMPTTPQYKHQNSVVQLFRPRGITLYSLRRSYARLMEDAGVPRTRRRAYLGHLRSLDQSDDYERHEVTAYLQEDAERLRQALAPHSDLFPDRMCSLP